MGDDLRRLLLTLALAAAAAFFVPATGHAGLCIGAPADEPAAGVYPGDQQRTFVQAENWRIDGPNGLPFHFHVDGCVPDGERLVTPAFPFRIGYYNKPGVATVRNIALVVHGDYGDRQLQVIDPPNAGFVCETTATGPQFCSQWITFRPDLSGLPYSGSAAFLIRAFMDKGQVNGKALGTVASFNAVVDNGKPHNDFTAGLQDAAGSAQWVGENGAEYCRSRWNGEDYGELPDKPFVSPLLWHGRIADTDAPSPPPSSYELKYDGNAHEGISGTTVRTGTVMETYDEFVNLESGIHKVTQRVNCSATEGEFAGFLSVWVEVLA